MSVKITVNNLKLSQKEGNLLAFATIDIAGKVEIYGCKLMNGDKGKWVAMPQRKGSDGKWYDNVRIKDESIKTAIKDAYLEAFSRVSGRDAGDEGFEGGESSEF